MRWTCLVLIVACGKSSDATKPKPDDPWAAKPSSDPARPDPPASDPKPAPVDGAFLGTWGTSHANWDMIATGAHGSEKHIYVFASDGTYAYHREGTLVEGTKYYVVDESGTITVDGNQITLTPQAVAAAVKSPDGTVLDSPEVTRERTSYTWQLHLFEGIGETDLVLTPSGSETRRDGPFAANDLFPRSYLLTPNPRFEWRFAP